MQGLEAAETPIDVDLCEHRRDGPPWQQGRTEGRGSRISMG